jgi:hypothetical protein
MRRRLSLVTVCGALLPLATTTLAGAATTHAPSIKAKASASCGTEPTAGGPAHIIAPHGVSCTRARKVIHDFATKGAFWHFVGTNHGNGYSPVDGWRCTLFMGHSDCKRGHAIIRAEPLPLHLAPPPSPSNPPEFRARLAGGTIGCGLGTEGMLCQGVPTVPEMSNPIVQVAKLQPTGQLMSCTEYEAAPQAACLEGNMGDPIPNLTAGETSTVGLFTCKVLQTGVECTVTATGKGFLITPESVTEVGG